MLRSSNMLHLLAPALLLSACASVPAQGGADAPEPATFLGHPVGQDFTLPDWDEVSGYLQALAAASPRVQMEQVGTTTEGRPFFLAAISSAQNLARLEQLRGHAAVLADPRSPAESVERALREGKLFLMISCAMHATETAAPQMAMELAWRLASSEEEPWRTARERLVVLLIPSTNPDGLDHVSHWYREHVHGPYEGSSLTQLYQHYAGHDNNRDWFALNLVETRIVTRLLYADWHPQVYWDVHQQGSRSERLFVPPFRDPLNPNLDPGVITAIDALGSRALWDLTRAGFQGISTGVSYDMWWNGGNRNVPVRHNVIGLLTEAASVNIASPVWRPLDSLRAPSGIGGQYAPSHRFPWPWEGGWWRMRDIIDYELAFAASLLGSLSREPELYLRNSLEAGRRNVERARGRATSAWLLPSDNRDRGAARRLAEVLLLSGVELHVAQGRLMADGRDYPAGSLVIPMDQPFATHVQDLFSLQDFPEGDAPYDVAGWTLPLLFGLRRIEVRGDLEGEWTRVLDPESAVAGFPGRSGPDHGWDALDSDSWRRVFEALRSGSGVAAQAGPEGLWLSVDEAGRPPRIGLYGPWSGSMDEGWMRWVLDEFGLPYARVRNEMLRAGQLSDFLDVLVLPSLSASSLDRGRAPGSAPAEFTDGLDPEGAVAVEEFVRAGGRLIAVGSSSAWAVDLFGLPLADAAAADPEFRCPGSVVRTVPEPHALTAGLPSSVPVFFSGSQAWELLSEEAEEDGRVLEVLLRWAPTRTLLSGAMVKPEAVAGKPAWLRVGHGLGTIHLFGFRPHYRGWSQAGFQLLFRALVLDPPAAGSR